MCRQISTAHATNTDTLGKYMSLYQILNYAIRRASENG